MKKKPSSAKAKKPRPATPSRELPGAADGDHAFVTIRKYANRRLYNTDTAKFVTLDDLRHMVIRSEPFVVVDAKTDQDITSSILAQIVADQESSGENMLPNEVLRQIISFYEKGMSESVSAYLGKSMEAFTDNWQQVEQIGEIGRRNMELFQQNLVNMFGNMATAGQPADAQDDEELEEELEDQLREIQAKLDALRDRHG